MKILILKKKINSQRILSFGKMRIDKEKFNKLKQLDRIEFRQKSDRIKSWQSYSLGFSFLKMLMFVVFFIILILPQGYLAFGVEFTQAILNAFRNIFPILVYAIVFGFIIDLVFSLIRIKNLGELYKEYFKIEVKK